MRRDNEISKQLQADLIKAYCKVVSEQHFWTMEEACAKAVKEPAPRFYITPKRARLMLSPMVHGDFRRVDLMPPNKRRMYYALYDVVIKMAEQRQFIGKSLTYITQYAVTQPAPEFFVYGHTLECTRLLLKQGRFDEDGCRLTKKGVRG